MVYCGEIDSCEQTYVLRDVTMIRFATKIAFIFVLILSQGTYSVAANLVPTELSPKNKPASHFRIRDILFVYHHDRLSTFEKPKKSADNIRPVKTHLHDKRSGKVVTADEAINLAFPSSSIEGMILESFCTVHEMHLEKATLHKLGKEQCLWQIDWNLFPAVGGFTGKPWSYHGIVTCSGKTISPEISLWSSFPICNKNQFIRSQLKLDDVPRIAGEKLPLFGDEIASLAKKRLANFTKEHGLESSFNGDKAKNTKPIPLQWRLQSLRLLYVDGDRDGRCVWKVEFTDESWGGETAIDSRTLAVWVSPTGKLSELSLGNEEIR